MSEPNLTLDALFCQQRLQTESMNVWHWLVFIPYFPVGCLLAVLRFALVFVVAILAPEKHRYQIFRYIGGLRCKTTGTLEPPENGALIVANHSNYLDPIVTNAALGKSQHLGTVIWHGVNFFSRVICRPTVSVADKGGNRGFLKALYKANEHHNMIVFPEGAVTDGITGLLQFQRSVFHLKKDIYLVGIKYRRALPFLQGRAMSRMMGIEVLVDLFQPWIDVELIPLGKLQRELYATPQEEADAAQRLIAEALGLKASRWTKHDRHKCLFPE